MGPKANLWELQENPGRLPCFLQGKGGAKDRDSNKTKGLDPKEDVPCDSVIRGSE